MANNAGAKKRIRQNAVRRLRNRYRIVTTRSQIKRLRGASEKDVAEGLLPSTISQIDRCVKLNLYHRNKADRLKSRLTRHVQGLS